MGQCQIKKGTINGTLDMEGATALGRQQTKTTGVEYLDCENPSETKDDDNQETEQGK